MPILSVTRGTIYVMRFVNGVEYPLWIPQHHYKEWAGCFSGI